MYVKRNDSGKITSVSVISEKDVTEYIDDADPELAEFLGENNLDAQKLLERSDAQMARVLEDMIILLVDKGVIQFTELPPAAQEKLLSRRDVRSKVQGVDLLDDDDIVEI